jgi:hypothetical protein
MNESKIVILLNMSMPEYLMLSIEERATVLWDQGTYLETDVYYGHTVKLYALHSFFVEVYYSPVTQSIKKVEVAYDQDLKKYLGKIKIEKL